MNIGCRIYSLYSTQWCFCVFRFECETVLMMQCWTDVVNSHFTATLREPETSVSRCSLCKLIDNQAAHSLDQDAQLQTFRALFLDVRQPSLSPHSRRSCVSCSLSATLVIKSPMNASLQEVGFVTSCSIIVTSFAVFLRTTQPSLQWPS